MEENEIIEIDGEKHEINKVVADEIRKRRAKEIYHSEKVKISNILEPTLQDPNMDYKAAKIDQIVASSNQHLMNTIQGLQEQIDGMGQTTEKKVNKNTVEHEKAFADLKANHEKQMAEMQKAYQVQEINASVKSAANALDLKNQYSDVFTGIFNQEFEAVNDSGKTIYRNRISGNLFYIDGIPGSLSQAVDSIKPKYIDMFTNKKSSQGLSKSPIGIPSEGLTHDETVNGMFKELGIN